MHRCTERQYNEQVQYSTIINTSTLYFRENEEALHPRFQVAPLDFLDHLPQFEWQFTEKSRMDLLLHPFTTEWTYFPKKSL